MDERGRRHQSSRNAAGERLGSIHTQQEVVPVGNVVTSYISTVHCFWTVSRRIARTSGFTFLPSGYLPVWKGGKSDRH